MQPFDVRLAYEGRAWCTVKFELGHNEISDAEESEHHLAQKFHAVSEPGSERARDLVDLRPLDKGEDLDAAVTWVNDCV